MGGDRQGVVPPGEGAWSGPLLPKYFHLTKGRVTGVPSLGPNSSISQTGEGLEGGDPPPLLTTRKPPSHTKGRVIIAHPVERFFFDSYGVVWYAKRVVWSSLVCPCLMSSGSSYFD